LIPKLSAANLQGGTIKSLREWDHLEEKARRSFQKQINCNAEWNSNWRGGIRETTNIYCLANRGEV